MDKFVFVSRDSEKLEEEDAVIETHNGVDRLSGISSSDFFQNIVSMLWGIFYDRLQTND